MGDFKGSAAIGAYGARAGFYVYCVDSFGYDEELGYFSASFTEFEAAPPMTEEQAAEKLRERCEASIEYAGDAVRLEMCERHDCSPSQLGEAYFEELLSDADGDVFAAYAEEYETLPFGAGEVTLEYSAGGQRDAFGDLEHYFVDHSTADAVKEMWDAWHLKRDVPEDVLARADEVIAALEAAPGPEQAAAAYAEAHPGCFSGAR